MTSQQRAIVGSMADDYATRHAAVPAKIGGMIVDSNQCTAEALRACLSAADKWTEHQAQIAAWTEEWKNEPNNPGPKIWS